MILEAIAKILALVNKEITNIGTMIFINNSIQASIAITRMIPPASWCSIDTAKVIDNKEF